MSTPPTTVVYLGLPVLLDWADGFTNYPTFGNTSIAPIGTFTPTSAVKVKAANGAVTIDGVQIEELDDSPELERAEQATSTKRFRMPYSFGRNLIQFMARGTILQDNEGNQVRLMATSIRKEKPGMCVMTVISEGLSFDLPPDEFSCEPIELGIDIVKYPRYFYSLLPTTTDTFSQKAAKQSIVRAIQTFRDSPFFPSNSITALNGLILSSNLTGQVHDIIQSQLSNNETTIQIPNINFTSDFAVTDPAAIAIQPLSDTIAYPPKATKKGDPNPQVLIVSLSKAISPDPVIQAAFAAAQEIISKLWRQEDTPYQVGFQITWSTYYYIKPFYNPGGYLENPIFQTGPGNPGLPDYFGSPSFDYATNTIFDNIGQYNPQCYSANGQTGGLVNISWLRKADVVDYQRTWFKWTRTWIGTASAHWDTDLYTQNWRPNSGDGPGSSLNYPFGYDLIFGS